MSALLPAIILVPLLSAAVLAYFRNSWSKTAISWVACGSVFASFAMVVALVVSPEEVFRSGFTTWGKLLDFGLLADRLSMWWMLVVTGCGLLIHVYSTGYMRGDPSFGRFMAKMNYFIFAMSLLVLADNFAGLLMGWANVGLASYLLIGFYHKKPAATSAAMKAFVMNMIGEAGMIAGIAIMFRVFGTFKFDAVFARAAEAPHAVNTICLLLLVGAVAKSAQMPLHTWLPYAMEGPTPVSALIHAATMVTAGVYLVSRAWPMFEVTTTAASAVMWVGAIGALFGAVVAAGQNDIKRVLAFSTLSQIGYMFLANGLGAYVAADFHFFTHAFFKAALFLTAGIVVHHYAGDQDIRKMGGLWQKDKFATVALVLGMLALIGIWPFAGFFSKDEILLAALHSHNYVVLGIALLAAGFTAFYNVRLFSLVVLGEPWVAPGAKVSGKKRASAHADHAHAEHGHGHAEHHHATPMAQVISVGILAVLSVISGWIFFFHGQLTFLEPAFHGLELVEEKINWALAGGAMGLAAVFGLVSWMLFRPGGLRRQAEVDLGAKAGPLVRMFYFDDLYEWIAIKPVQALAAFAANVGDAKIIDGLVDGLGKVAAALGSGLRALSGGYVRRYALTVFGGVILMLCYYVFYA